MSSREAVDPRRADSLVADLFADSVVPTLIEYIKIPNKSPAFDPDWERNGHMSKAMDLIVAWCRAQPIDGMRIDVIRLPGRTPLLFIEVPGEIDDTVLLYGHMDKQPETTGWADGLGPWQPVMRGDRLYGARRRRRLLYVRRALRRCACSGSARAARARASCDRGVRESGSSDLPHYIEHLAGRIGKPRSSSVSTRAPATANGSGAHVLRGSSTQHMSTCCARRAPGEASGIVPSSFGILRMLLGRWKTSRRGRIRPEWLYPEIPAQRVEADARNGPPAGRRRLGPLLVAAGRAADPTTPSSCC
jgi:hypothetical protein